MERGSQLQRRFESALAFATVLLAAGPALASGDPEFLLMPIGTLASLVTLVILAVRARIRAFTRVLAILIAVLSAVLQYGLVPPTVSSPLPRWYFPGVWLLLGVVPPLALGIPLVRWATRVTAERNRR